MRASRGLTVAATALLLGGCALLPGEAGVDAGPLPDDLCGTSADASGLVLRVVARQSSTGDHSRTGTCSLAGADGEAVAVTLARLGDTSAAAAAARVSDGLTDFCRQQSDSYVRDDDRLEGFAGPFDCLLVTDPDATERPATAVVGVSLDGGHSFVTVSVVLPRGTVDDADSRALDVARAVRRAITP